MASADTVLAMKGMAADPLKRKLLLKDATCMGGLIMVLSNPDSKIVTSALETLILMADTNDHKKLLRGFIGMTKQLETIINSKQSDARVHSLAEKLYVMITESCELQTPLKDTGNSRSTSRKSSTSKNKSLQGSKTRHITLQIRGLLDKTDRDVLMRLILQVKGVVSVTFDMNKKRCFLRAKPDVKPEPIVQAVAKSMTMTAQQVVKDEYGAEVLVSFGANPQDLDKENTSLPDYLPEDPDSPKADSRSLARNKKDEKKSGWLSSAANFLTNSFYW
ncbi:armadillo repeat-containing protein 1-like [Saccostrea cucullata]|uniref:armadillo repeat-containing protein 1-like n=2 Tax=Saccostrea cuccullata TaxID=36930 RepID=UPI002ED2BE91